jgi:hypothetical protein
MDPIHARLDAHDYIKELEKRNRLLKQRSASHMGGGAEGQRLRRLEDGFHTNLQGANAERLRDKSRGPPAVLIRQGPVRATRDALPAAAAGGGGAAAGGRSASARGARDSGTDADSASIGSAEHASERAGVSKWGAPDGLQAQKWSMDSTLYLAAADGSKVRVGGPAAGAAGNGTGAGAVSRRAAQRMAGVASPRPAAQPEQLAHRNASRSSGAPTAAAASGLARGRGRGRADASASGSGSEDRDPGGSGEPSGEDSEPGAGSSGDVLAFMRQMRGRGVAAHRDGHARTWLPRKPARRGQHSVRAPAARPTAAAALVRPTAAAAWWQRSWGAVPGRGRGAVT